MKAPDMALAVRGSITIATGGSISSSRTTWFSMRRRSCRAARIRHATGEACRCICGPQGLPQEHCRLYHNNGDGTFTDVSERAGIKEPSEAMALLPWLPISMATAGRTSTSPATASPSLLFRNNRDGTFSERGLEAGMALNEDGKEQAGMGLGIGDFDTDGHLDIFKTHFSEDTNILYRNNGKGNFRDVTTRAGLAVETRFVGWGAAMQDLDNDGLPDIFFTTGMVSPELEASLRDAPYKTPNVVFRNLGGGQVRRTARGSRARQ